MQDIEKNIFLLNLFWFILAIIYFLFVMKVDFYSNGNWSYITGFSVDSGPYYIFKFQFFLAIVTFLAGYGYKYLLQKSKRGDS